MAVEKVTDPALREKIEKFIEMYSNHKPDPVRAGSIAGKKNNIPSVVHDPGTRDKAGVLDENGVRKIDIMGRYIPVELRGNKSAENGKRPGDKGFRAEPGQGQGQGPDKGSGLVNETVEPSAPVTVDLAGVDMKVLSAALKPRLTKYIPVEPTPKQTAFLVLNNVKEVLYGGDLCLTTPILTVNRGWQTMGSVEVGDYVFTEYGTPTKVTWKSEVMHNVCYELTFNNRKGCSEVNSGAEKIIAGAHHEWCVHRRTKYGRVIEVQYTEEIHNRFVNTSPKNIGSLYAIPTAHVHYSAKKQVVDPYVFGTWLGDGCKTRGNMATVEDEVRAEYLKLKYDVYFNPSSFMHDRPDIYGEEGRLSYWCSHRLREELRQVGFLKKGNDKYIPDEYLYGSYEQRLALLQGIMDTDGSVDNRSGMCNLTLANVTLAYQCEELIKSLGMKVNCKEYTETRDDPRYPKGTYVSYAMDWTTNIPVFRMPRKLARQPKIQCTRQRWHFLSNIEIVPTVPTQCIEVENPTHLYLATKSLIPTRNSAGGGKSIAQLMGALQFVDVPGYAAILFRKTYSDLALPGALISVAKEWLMPFVERKEVHWSDKDKKFTFPSGATLSFGYLESSGDCYRYQGSEFQYIGFDECTHIDPENYRYLFSRLRKTVDLPVPLRVRATCNPGGIWGQYYHDRFFKEGPEKGRVFIPAGIQDNPHIDAVQYREALSELDPITRAQLEDGNWEIKQSGNMFDRKWFLVVPSMHLPESRTMVRYWDMASTDPSKRKKTSDKRAPDWTVGLKLSMHQGLYWIEDIARVQKKPSDTEQLVKQCAEFDGYRCAIRMEQEPGSSGDIAVDHYARTILDGYNFKGVRSTGSKVQRAEAVSAAAQMGRIMITENCRNKVEFFEEAELFPFGAKDDIVDTLSGAFTFFRKPCILAAPTMARKASGSYWGKI